MDGYYLNECLCCGSKSTESVIDLGYQPPANSFLELGAPLSKAYPLALNVCTSCWHSQLNFVVNRQTLFDDYLYVSGTSHTLYSYFEWFASALRIATASGSKILDIAANDGSLVACLRKQGLDAEGIDPAENVVSKAMKEGLPLHVGYWPDAENKFSTMFDAITCLNVLAHVDRPLEFLEACERKLSPDGILIIQTSQARMISSGQFDTCYHEHVSFFNTRSIAVLAEKAKLKLAQSCLTAIHGDSQVFVLARDPENRAASLLAENLRCGAFAIMERLESVECEPSLFNIETYREFAKQVTVLLARFRETVAHHRSEGFNIAFVGAAAKAMTFLNAAGVVGDLLIDEAPLKIGRHAPGVNLVVSPLAAAKCSEAPTLFILTAWNFSQELAAKLRATGIPQGSRFLTYFPTFRLFD
ncbi:MAG: class I SAM-dependent methyltransferase [Betaproteobacteria bacterium]|nr:class I SAM-dependent methyltransferase [Betaproteobacteria bacterium]